MSRICWSSDSSCSMPDVTDITRGCWATHRFDITTMSKHKTTTREEEWWDVCDEMAKEFDHIWTANFGPDWREEYPKIVDGWKEFHEHLIDHQLGREQRKGGLF